VLHTAPTSSSLTETLIQFTADSKPLSSSLYYFLQTPVNYSLLSNISNSINVTHKKQSRSAYPILYHQYLATGRLYKPYSKTQTQLRPKSALLLSLIGLTDTQWVLSDWQQICQHTLINYTGRISCLRLDHRCFHGMSRRTKTLDTIKLPRLVWRQKKHSVFKT
jgi:hypothetical protein